jgi:hypothetical protein
MAQVQAAYHGILLEKFLAGQDYAQLVQDQGLAAANLEAVRRTLQETPSDMHSFLKDLQSQGWSVDMVRFRGDAKAVKIR